MRTLPSLKTRATFPKCFSFIKRNASHAQFTREFVPSKRLNSPRFYRRERTLPRARPKRRLTSAGAGDSLGYTLHIVENGGRS